jgi:hypothetical protein
MRRAARERTWIVLVAAVATAACSHPGAKSSGPHAGEGGAAGTTGAAGAAGAPSNGGDAAAVDGPSDASTETLAGDPGRVTLHRLTRAEYDNTAKDLLGVATTPASLFPADESVGGFDNMAEALSITSERYQRCFDAAKALADFVWSDVTLRGRIVTCAPDGGGKCARDIVSAFGLRAWRRPLTSAEVTTLAQPAVDASAAGDAAFSAALKRSVTVMLASLPFLYKVEVDPAPTSTAPHLLTGWELASRLSYLLWGTMPDDTLLAVADQLQDDAVLGAQLERMLDHPRSDAFVQSFAGQWLGARAMAAHGVDRTAYPTWDEALRDAMTEEMYRFFDGLIDRPYAGFFSEDLHYLNARLVLHYGVTGLPAFDGFVPAQLPAGHTGFLGLAGFLTMTSPTYRSSPSKRGAWIREHLLCDPPGSHMGFNPVLNLGSDATSPRKALTFSLAVDQSCTTCHGGFDVYGFPLEHFDGVGHFRSNYSPMEPIDATATLPGGKAVDGAGELAAALANDPRVTACAVRKTLGYALGRVLDAGDAARVDALVASWKKGTFRELLHAVVFDPAFRQRRGEAP